MSFDELRSEVSRLSPEEQRLLLGYLVALDLKQDSSYMGRISARLTDKDPGNWVSLKDAERELRRDAL